MEAVEDQPDIGMIGPAHHFPRIAVVPDMAPPRERLEADADVVICGKLAQGGEIVCHAIDPAKRLEMNRGTDQHVAGAELAHELELMLGASQSAVA